MAFLNPENEEGKPTIAEVRTSKLKEYGKATKTTFSAEEFAVLKKDFDDIAEYEVLKAKQPAEKVDHSARLKEIDVSLGQIGTLATTPPESLSERVAWIDLVQRKTALESEKATLNTTGEVAVAAETARLAELEAALEVK